MTLKYNRNKIKEYVENENRTGEDIYMIKKIILHDNFCRIFVDEKIIEIFAPDPPDLIINTDRSSFIIEHTQFNQGKTNRKGNEINKNRNEPGTHIYNTEFYGNAYNVVKKKINKLSNYMNNELIKHKDNLQIYILIESHYYLPMFLNNVDDSYLKSIFSDFSPENRILLNKFSFVFTKEMNELCLENNINGMAYIEPDLSIFGYKKIFINPKLVIEYDEPPFSVNDQKNSKMLIHRG